MDVQYVFSGYESEQCKPEEVFGPENKKECPCDTCPLMEQCLENATECSAMRNWCSTGDYWDTDGWDTKIEIDKKTKKKKTVKYWRKSDLQRLLRGIA